MKPYVVITGTSRGLGRELAAALVADRRVLAINRRAGGQPDELVADLGDKGAVEHAAEALARQLAGQTTVDFYLNAAIYGEDETVRDLDPAQVGQVLYTNVFGQLSLVEVLLAAGHRVKLVAISSAMGSVSQAPEAYHFAYGSSKAALNLSVRLLKRREPDLDYCLVDPGWMQTEMGGKGATEDPAEVAAQLVRLAAHPDNWNRPDGLVEVNTGRIVPW